MLKKSTISVFRSSNIAQYKLKNQLLQTIIYRSYQAHFKMSYMLEDDRADNQRGIVSTNSINQEKFKEFDRKKSFLEYKRQSLETLKQLLKKRLFEVQYGYYKMMLEKETDSLFNYSPRDRDESVTYESRKRGAGNSFQFDRIMKSGKPSSPTVPKLLHGTTCFKHRLL